MLKSEPKRAIGSAPRALSTSFSSKPPPSSLLVYRYAFTRPQLAPRRPSERSEHDSMGADAISSSLPSWSMSANSIFQPSRAKFEAPATTAAPLAASRSAIDVSCPVGSEPSGSTTIWPAWCAVRRCSSPSLTVLDGEDIASIVAPSTVPKASAKPNFCDCSSPITLKMASACAESTTGFSTSLPSAVVRLNPYTRPTAPASSSTCEMGAPTARTRLPVAASTATAAAEPNHSKLRAEPATRSAKSSASTLTLDGTSASARKTWRRPCDLIASEALPA
mmetsp:Transcript_32951/g.56377  ORF Transcript_32951/g.56377 Transcript_32951/m.56377 type:complete len:278 (-) Transcript_32951:726-1559(-)